MNKLKSTILLAILLSTTFTAFLPMATASTGYILMETTTPPSAVQPVAAGENINLYFGVVSFSGGQFYLVWSADGFSQISSGDFKYTPTFTTAQLHNLTAPYTTVTDGDFEWVIGNDWVNGSIPKNIAGGHYYIKCFDGSATSVAVTDNYINILPSFEVVPDWGPGGTAITLKGYAFTGSAKVNLSYWDPIEGEYVTIKNLLALNAKGQFNYSMIAPDMKQVLTPDGEQSIGYDTITFRAIDNKTEYGALGELDFDFTEYQRGLIQVADELADFEGGYLFGNETDFGALGVTLEVLDDLIISGQYFYPGNVTVWWEGTSQIGTVLTNGSGFFNKTFTVPITSVGLHWVVLKDKNVKFAFQVEVIPTLILIPEEGPIGTVVTVKAYGFEEDTAFYIYWYEKVYDDGTWYWLANVTTGSNGQFNKTVTFTVFHTYGGIHDVSATTTYEGEEFDGDLDEYATAEFTVTARLRVVPSTIKNDGSLVSVIGDGLRVEDTWSNSYAHYLMNIDNQWTGAGSGGYYSSGVLKCNNTGDMIFKFVAAGFNPGVHVVSLYGYTRGEVYPSDDSEPYHDSFEPEAFALFTVTGPSDDTQVILTQLTAMQTSLNTKLNDLSTQMTSVSSAVSALNTLLSKGVSDIRADITGVKGDVKALSDAQTSGFNSVNSAIGTCCTSMTSSIDNLGKSLSSKIDSLNTNLGKSVSDNANSIQQSIQSAQKATSDDIKKSVGDQGTLLLLIAILVAITLVVELAIMISRLS